MAQLSEHAPICELADAPQLVQSGLEMVDRAFTHGMTAAFAVSGLLSVGCSSADSAGDGGDSAVVVFGCQGETGTVGATFMGVPAQPVRSASIELATPNCVLARVPIRVYGWGMIGMVRRAYRSRDEPTKERAVLLRSGIA
jgi:hypothetical protein